MHRQKQDSPRKRSPDKLHGWAYVKTAIRECSARVLRRAAQRRLHQRRRGRQQAAPGTLPALRARTAHGRASDEADTSTGDAPLLLVAAAAAGGVIGASSGAGAGAGGAGVDAAATAAAAAASARLTSVLLAVGSSSSCEGARPGSQVSAAQHGRSARQGAGQPCAWAGPAPGAEHAGCPGSPCCQRALTALVILDRSWGRSGMSTFCTTFLQQPAGRGAGVRGRAGGGTRPPSRRPASAVAGAASPLGAGKSGGRGVGVHAVFRPCRWEAPPAGGRSPSGPPT